MKNLIKHIGIMMVALMAFSVTAVAQFDDVYFDPSKDLYSVSNNYADANASQRRADTRTSRDQSYNYTRDDQNRAQSDQYAYDDDEYDYYNDDYYQEGNYYFDDYAYARRINRFHRNRFFYDPFMYDDFYMMGMMRGMSMSPFGYQSMYSPFYRPGLHFSLGLGFGMPFGYNSFYGMGYPRYGSIYSPFYSPYSMFYDPIMAYNRYGYGGYGGYGYGYPYIYRNNVNHGELPQYYRGARTSGAGGVVPTARDGRIQVRSSGGQNSGEYKAPTTRQSPRSEDRSNRPGTVSPRGDQKASPRSSGDTPTRTSPRSSTYTPDDGARTNRVYRSPGTTQQVESGDRSTYTPRSQSTRRSYTPSSSSPRKSYTPSSGSSRRTYTPTSRSSGRNYTPSSRQTGNSSINRSSPTQRSATPSRSSGSTTRSSGSSSSSGGRTSPR